MYARLYVWPTRLNASTVPEGVGARLPCEVSCVRVWSVAEAFWRCSDCGFGTAIENVTQGNGHRGTVDTRGSGRVLQFSGMSSGRENGGPRCRPTNMPQTSPKKKPEVGGLAPQLYHHGGFGSAPSVKWMTQKWKRAFSRTNAWLYLILARASRGFFLCGTHPRRLAPNGHLFRFCLR